ncbi:AAA family ATPase [Gloeobacter morelensis]|uniref:AAA family ATPase n=1 Tax=Gloeobacter morelensis MG652769 TaxID=2781736 RepID=A0ABY3PKU4_9CYAN|nr:bifunctional aminoglycoside phosphotransferase/ATP-binding protein [Gloeobacter morelensis]UFP94251.1 AAA family ATPase [Gloeobacter morelensis MG652769]
MLSTQYQATRHPSESASLPAFLAAMARPEFYPHPVETVTIVQTHISYVVLAGVYAYKFKKSVHLGFIDYATLEQRRRYCYEELRLNRRFAPGLYLDVVAIVAVEGGGYRLAEAEAVGALEYCVRMRRFEEEQLWSRLVPRDALNPGAIEQLAGRLAHFHAGAAIRKPPLAWIREAIEGTFSQALPYAARLGLELPFAEIRRFNEAFLATQAPLLAERRERGRVRECHGDLHLGNIVQMNGEPLMFDGIEFSDRLRTTDVMAEVAFLVMDLEAHGRFDHANRLLNSYLAASGDWEGVAVLPLYLCYRACVRGWVHARRSDQPDLDPAEQQEALAVARGYFELAWRYTRPAPPRLWMMHGLSGSGKSTVARDLSLVQGAIHLPSDAVRKHLAGLAPAEHAPAPAGGGLYSRQMSERTYTRLVQLAEICLKAGFAVVLDARYPRRQQRRQVRALADRLGAPLTLLVCLCPWPLLKQRLEGRTADLSDATPALLDWQLAETEPPAGDELGYTRYLDTTGPGRALASL